MVRLALVLLLIASVARAEVPGDKAPLFAAAFDGWLDQVGARQGIIALRYNGQPVASWARGRDAADQVDIASLSKAITGSCIAALVDEGRLTYDSRASDVLNLRGAAPVTIAQLLTHSTGLDRDHTQRPMAWWKDDPTPRWAEVTPRALDPDRLTGAGYYYSNENYAVLGTVIEAVTGEPYKDACQARVLDPAGVQGDASDRFAAYLPWGGWAMSMADYAGFVDYAYGVKGVLSDRLADLPSAQIDGPVRYGLGMTQRVFEGGRNLWHFGALCFEDGPELGTFAARFRSGWTLAVWYDTCVTWPEMIALDAALVQVAYAP